MNLKFILKNLEKNILSILPKFRLMFNHIEKFSLADYEGSMCNMYKYLKKSLKNTFLPPLLSYFY